MSLKPCRRCGHQVSPHALKCPKCGIERPGKSTKGRTTALLAVMGISLVAMISLAIGGAFKAPAPRPETPPSPAASSPPSKPALELLGSRWGHDEYGSHYVTGRIRNNSGHVYSYAEVDVGIYDTAGNRVESTMDNVTNLAPGEVWKFKASVLEDGPVTYRVTSVSGR